MRKSVFIISKPLQYFNVCNIEDFSFKVLIIVNAFKGAEDLFLNVKNKSNYWDEVLFCNNYSEAFYSIRNNPNKNLYNKLYIDGDYSFSMIKELRNLRNIEIFVYEEGIGTYTNNIRNIVQQNKYGKGSFFQKIKWSLTSIFFKLNGHENYHGGFSGTKGIYVYDKSLLLKNKPNFKKEILNFKLSFLDHLRKFEDRNFIADDYGQLMEKVEGKKILLYLTSWEINPNIIEILNRYPNYYKILKPHPHIKEHNLKIFEDNFDFQISGGNMVEFLLSDLIEVSIDLIVVHSGSGALMHFKNAQITEIIL